MFSCFTNKITVTNRHICCRHMMSQSHSKSVAEFKLKHNLKPLLSIFQGLKIIIIVTHLHVIIIFKPVCCITFNYVSTVKGCCACWFLRNYIRCTAFLIFCLYYNSLYLALLKQKQKHKVHFISSLLSIIL